MQNYSSIEPFTDEEASFMSNRYLSECTAFKKSMMILYLIVIPMTTLITIYAIYYSRYPKDLDQSPKYEYSYVVLFVGFFLFIITFFAYYYYAYPLYLDVKNGQKIVMQSKIIKKEFFPATNQYFIFIDSADISKIEMDYEKFMQFEVGDEINIEFAKHSKEYFSYF